MIYYCEDYWNDIESIIKNIPRIEEMFNKSILITGGTGMVCSTVIEVLTYLNRNYQANVQIYIAGRSQEKVKRRFPINFFGENIHFIQFDARKESDIKLPDLNYVIYGASPANPTSFSIAPVDVILANIIGLKSILSKMNPLIRGLYISSSEVYGKKQNGIPYVETDYGYVDILNPRAAYPCAKRLAETLCSAYIKQYGLDLVIARPGHIYGPSITLDDNRASAQFTRKSAAGANIILKSAGLQLRSYCYTLDCASAILCILLNGTKGEAYNISNRQSVVTIRDVADVFAKRVNRRIIFENPSDQERSGFNLMENSALDAKKLENLHWRAKFDLYSGVAKTLKYYKM